MYKGGTGKSHVFNALMEYTRLRYGKTFGIYSSTMAFGPSGCSSHNLGGRTWQSAVSVSYNNSKSVDSAKLRLIGENFRGIRLIILDEISMISPSSLATFEHRLRHGIAHIEMDETKKKRILQTAFGGVHVIFGGDFYQLDPVMAGVSFYTPPRANENTYTKKGRALFDLINVCIELTENCRISKDSQGSVLANFNRTARIGQPDEKLMNLLNGTRISLHKTVGPLLKDIAQTYDSQNVLRGPHKASQVLVLAATWKQVPLKIHAIYI